MTHRTRSSSKLSLSVCSAFLALSLGLASAAQAQEAQPEKPAAAAKTSAAKLSPSEQLRKVFADSDEASLKRNPVNAIFRGDMRYADRLGNFFSDASTVAEIAAAKADLKALGRIKYAALGPVDQLAYDVFAYQTRFTLKGYTPAIQALTAVRPIDHFNGIHTWYPSFASGQGAAPFKTVTDYENNLKRHSDYAAMIDTAILQFKKGLKTGVVQPRITVEIMISQLDGIIAEGIEKSTFYGPIGLLPATFSAAEKTKLTTDYTRNIKDVIQPAHTRLRDFLKTEYLPAARAGAGLVHMKGGATLYNLLIESNTTLPMTANEIHTLGLSEVGRITAEMDGIRQKVGFTGTLAEFFVHLRTDPKFKPKSKQELVDGYYAIGKKVDARIAEYFSTIPKTPLEIRYYEPYREKNSAGASYENGVYDAAKPANNRPGVFYFNTYDLPSRTTPGMETLYLHEAAPGHHFQISLAQENAALPAFMRYGGNTAFIEGWALYAESLWDELGMESDPYQRFGGLDDEMLRAMRLVVDSGLHAKGWTREKAIDYMLANSSMGKTDATAEVERYIAIPGQALAYKVGQLTILRLRAQAEKALGSKFDLKAFHAEVLMTGALPMTVLEKKINAWIARVQKSGAQNTQAF
jgi:uncharacterized protein (DUF885 family)